MPTLTITADDSSPIFQYSSNWSKGTSSSDGALDRYFQSTFSTTQIDGATMNFTFFGTSIQIYGSKRPTHGSFQIQIDNTTYDQINTQNSPDLFQELLFGVDKLKNTLHEVIVTNRGSGNTRFDIDFVTWQMEIGEVAEDISVQTIQDYTPSIRYEPSNAWATNPALVGTYNGGHGHASTAPQSSVEYSFVGAAVSLYGPIGPEGAPFSVRVDDRPFQNLTSIYPSRYIPQSLLYHIGGLRDGLHTIKIVHGAQSLSGQVLGIDYFNMFSTPSIDARSVGGLPPSIVGAIAAGTIVGLIAALLLIIYYVRNKRLAIPEHVRRKDEAVFWNFLWKWKTVLSKTLETRKQKQELANSNKLKKRKGKRKMTDVEPFDVNEVSAINMTSTSEAEMAYLIPNYGPVGAIGSGGSGGGGRKGEKIEVVRQNMNLSESSQPSTSSGNLHPSIFGHSKKQSSMSAPTVMNQQLVSVNEVGAVTFRSPVSGTLSNTSMLSYSNSGLNPQMPGIGVQRQVSTIRRQSRTQSRPGPSSSLVYISTPPFPPGPSHHSYTQSPPPLNQISSFSSSGGQESNELGRRSMALLPLPPGAARPVLQSGDVVIDENSVRPRQGSGTGSRVDVEEPPEYDWDVVPHHLR